MNDFLVGLAMGGHRVYQEGACAATLDRVAARRVHPSAWRSRAGSGSRSSAASSTSFSRPHVSDDNPYSEVLFRMLKHVPRTAG